MDRTLLFGEGLFETIRWLGENRKLKRHYIRLKNSCEFFGYPYPSYEEFLRAINEKAHKTPLYLKFLLTFQGKDYFADYPQGYEYKVIVKELPAPPQSIRLCVSPYGRHSSDPICRHKTTSYLFNILVKRDALRRGYFDALVLNERSHVCETSSSNLIFVKGSRLYTPARENGLLWGTTLSAVADRMEIKEENIKDFTQYDCAFAVNSIVGCVPVEGIENHTFAIDQDLLKELQRVIEDEERTYT